MFVCLNIIALIALTVPTQVIYFTSKDDERAYKTERYYRYTQALLYLALF